jgi:hypothetical protein
MLVTQATKANDGKGGCMLGKRMSARVVGRLRQALR